jgi:hypothetical protein
LSHGFAAEDESRLPTSRIPSPTIRIISTGFVGRVAAEDALTDFDQAKSDTVLGYV